MSTKDPFLSAVPLSKLSNSHAESEVGGEGEAIPAELDLARLEASLRAIVGRIEGGLPLEASDVQTSKIVLRFLQDEVARRSTLGRPDPVAHLRAAAVWADLFVIHVPDSPKRGLAGRAVSRTKRGFVASLRPFHFELLRPQKSFNEELIGVLREVVGKGRAFDPAPLRDWAAKRLSELSDNRRWAVKSHRVEWSGRAVEMLKRTYLRASQAFVSVALSRQFQWNLAAVEAVQATLAGGARDLATLHEILGRLGRFGALPTPEELPRVARASFPLWMELFRRQEAFNIEVWRALAAHWQLPHSGEEGRSEEYQSWAIAQERSQIRESTAALSECSFRPKLSVVVPTYRTPEPLLRACIESVRDQTYDNWELCIADDASNDASMLALLREYSDSDTRIRVKFLPSNRGIAGTTNEAISLATGDFVCFLDHDDTLAPHALAEVVLALNSRRDSDLLYTDEDHLDMQGRRYAPFFKPDWSPDILRSCNYICHFLVVRREVLERVGRLSTGFDGSQDFELLLRLAEHTDRVAHIPKILYHWRAAPQSTAANIANKPGASNAGIRALEAHLRRTGDAGRVESTIPTHYRVRYEIQGTPLVSVIVTAPQSDRLATLVESITSQTRYPNFELIVVSPAAVSSANPRARVINWTQPASRPAMANHGARVANGEFFVFLHEDMEIIDPEWLHELLGHAQRRQVGAVGPKLVHSDGSLQHIGWLCTPTGEARSPFTHMVDATFWTAFGCSHWTRNFLAVSDACLMVARSRFESVGGFDVDDALPESGLCQKLWRLGLRVVHTPHTKLVHHDVHTGASRPTFGSWSLARDPFFNPQLSSEFINGKWGTGSTAMTSTSSSPRPAGKVVQTNVTQLHYALAELLLNPAPSELDGGVVRRPQAVGYRNGHGG